MPVEITTPSQTSTLPASHPVAANALASLDVTILSTPANIEQLLRQITISGTATLQPVSNQVNLTTVLGNFSFSYAQLPDDVKQTITQQLEQILQNQKPFTAILQPGSPPTQAVLFLPNANSSATASPNSSAATPPRPSSTPLTFTPGSTISAVVLPPDIVVPGAITVPKAAIPNSINTTNAETNLPDTPAANPLTANSSPVTTETKTINSTAQNLTPSTATNLINQSPGNTATSAAQTTTPNSAGPANNSSTPVALPTSGSLANSTPAQPEQTAASPSTIATPSSPPVILESGKEVALHISAVSLPNAPPLAPNAPGQIVATVIGNGANGHLILKTDDATLYVRSNVEAPVGTNLLLTVDVNKPPAPAVVPPNDDQNFAALQEVLDALTQANPVAAQQLTQTHIPQPALPLAGPLLFFLHALKQGDTKGWLSRDALETLTKADKLALLGKLDHALKESIESTRDPQIGDWKSYPIPLLMDGKMQAMTLHVHSDGGRSSSSDQAQGKDPKHIRFLIDVRMSRIGPMQLDGLVRPQKLDMIVRSMGGLPPGLPQDLRKSYIESIEAMGYTGSLSFQIGRQGWIEPHKTVNQSLMT